MTCMSSSDRQKNTARLRDLVLNIDIGVSVLLSHKAGDIE